MLQTFWTDPLKGGSSKLYHLVVGSLHCNNPEPTLEHLWIEHTMPEGDTDRQAFYERDQLLTFE